MTMSYEYASTIICRELKQWTRITISICGMKWDGLQQLHSILTEYGNTHNVCKTV